MSTKLIQINHLLPVVVHFEDTALNKVSQVVFIDALGTKVFSIQGEDITSTEIGKLITPILERKMESPPIPEKIINVATERKNILLQRGLDVRAKS